MVDDYALPFDCAKVERATDSMTSVFVSSFVSLVRSFIVLKFRTVLPLSPYLRFITVILTDLRAYVLYVNTLVELGTAVRSRLFDFGAAYREPFIVSCGLMPLLAMYILICLAL